MINKYGYDDVPLTQTRIHPRLKEVVEYGYILGLDDYQCFDEGFRQWLNQRIVDHFWLREISAETPQIFVVYLNRAMRENMLYFDPVFESFAKKEVSVLVNSSTLATGQSSGKQINASGESSRTHSDSGSDTHINGKTLSTRNPQQNMSASSRDSYYDSGQFSDSDTRTNNSSDSQGSGNSNSTSDMLNNYMNKVTGLSGILPIEAISTFIGLSANPLAALFAKLEPCFSQFFNTMEGL